MSFIMHVSASTSVGFILGQHSGVSFENAQNYLKLIALFYPLCFTGNTFAGYFDGIGRISIPFIGAVSHITLAHELAHHIIHKRIFSGTGVAAALYNHDADEDATEWQANYLAKAILMPNGQVKRCFYALRPVCRSKSEFVCKMAEIFEVSKQAMEIRLKEFALI